MRIVQVESLLSRGPYPHSRHWRGTRQTIHDAITRCCWPPGSGSFTIHADSGKNRGARNRVLPIKAQFLEYLREAGWAVDGTAKNALGRSVGRFDAVLAGPAGPVVVEWKTGSITYTHRSLNKMSLFLGSGRIAAGTLIVPSRELNKFLADRAGTIQDLKPYFVLWKSSPCQNGLLELVVVEHDGTSCDVPRIGAVTPRPPHGPSLGPHAPSSG